MKILVTGGAGFIGSNLTRRLVELGHEITILDKLSKQVHGEEPRTSFLYLSVADIATFIEGSVNSRDDLSAAVAGQDAIVHLAASLPEVRAVDLAGPYQDGGPSWDEWRELFAEAKSLGLRTTAHMAESEPDDVHPELFPHLDRIGHGIQIALRHPHLLPELAERGICLEVCPTTYLRTNTIRDLTELRPVFARCEAAGVPVSIATDNPALHGDSGRIVGQYEILVRAEVIHFNDILRYAEVGYRHAFGAAGVVGNGR